MFCPMCGAPNEDADEFCGNCGAALDPDAVPAPEGSDAAELGEVEAVEVATGDQEVIEETEIVADAVAETDAMDVETPDVTEAVDEGLVEVPQQDLEPPPPPRQAVRSAPPAAAMASTPQTSGMAIASLVMGIVGLTIMPFIGSILALIFGYMARKDIRQRPDEVSGDGLALAGIVMGWIAIGLVVLGLLVFGGITACSLCGVFGAGAAGSY